MLATATPTGRSGQAAPNTPGRNRVGRYPLAQSRRKTATKNRKPRTRPTLVAPMFPDPTVRMSTPAIPRAIR